MKRKGFTLAEVLIALAIVGVIAALTIPSLVSSYRKNLWASSLATAVSNLETATTTMIVKEGADDIYGTKAWKNVVAVSPDLNEGNIQQFLADLGNTIQLSFKEDEPQAKEFYESTGLYDINGNKFNPTVDAELERGLTLTGKNNIVYFFYFESAVSGVKTEEDVYNLGGNLTYISAYVEIDVNGKAKPNTIGKDVFKFVMGRDGKWYPIGGIDYAVYRHDNTLTWKDTSSPYACTDSTKENRGWGCTARLVENDYKMDY